MKLWTGIRAQHIRRYYPNLPYLKDDPSTIKRFIWPCYWLESIFLENSSVFRQFCRQNNSFSILTIPLPFSITVNINCFSRKHTDVTLWKPSVFLRIITKCSMSGQQRQRYKFSFLKNTELHNKFSGILHVIQWWYYQMHIKTRYYRLQTYLLAYCMEQSYP